jgi:hypothetical protein
MIGLIGEPEQEGPAVKDLVAALFECSPEAVEFIPVGCALLFVAAIVVAGNMVYQLMMDPNAENPKS